MMAAKLNSIGWQTIIAILIFGFFVAYWVFFQIFLTADDANHRQIYTFSSIYGVMAFYGALCGLWIAKQWGGVKSVLGLGLIFLSLGLLSQEFGQIVYSFYYIVQHLETANYPSLGDVGFFGTIPLYCLGVIYLGRASGIALRFKSVVHVIPAILITFAMLGLGFFLFLQDYVLDLSDPIKTFLDFGYPLGAAIYISLAIGTYILSKGVLGGIMKVKILFLLFALCLQFLADYMFLYQTSRGTWVDSGINELIYLISYFVMTMALLQFGSVYKKLKDGN